MVRVIAVLVLLLSLVGSAAAYVSGRAYSTGAGVTNPTAGQVLVSTGAINEGAPNGTRVSVHVNASSTVATTMQMLVKNASDVTVQQFRFTIPANGTVSFGNADFVFDAPNGYYLQVAMPSALTGTVHASIWLGVVEGY